MRDQYAGDLSDVLKFAFLRGLARTDRSLGIAWYYVPGNDGRNDGRLLEWHNEPAWKRLDEQLFDGLKSLPVPSVEALEEAAIWPGRPLFHRVPMPSRAERAAWAAAKRKVLHGADIVFLDPDNGVGGETKKHATLSEVRELREATRAIAFITFPGRGMKHDLLVRQLHERVKAETTAGSILTLRINVAVRIAGTPYYVQRQRWFTMLDADATLIARAQAFATALASVPHVKVRLDYALESRERRRDDDVTASAQRVPSSRVKTMIDRHGEREVELTEPGENGIQWSKHDE